MYLVVAAGDPALTENRPRQGREGSQRDGLA
jgi:hypothetical protein